MAVTWLLEGLSKQSLGFVNSEGYLAIEASRWRLSQTTCYGNAFAVRTGWKQSGPDSLFSLSVSLSHAYTHIFMVNMVGARMRRSYIFPPLSASPLSLSPHIDPPSLSPDFTLRTKQLDRREGFPAGPDLSCKKMTHLLKKLSKRERRQFRGERKHKQRCFNMMVASGTQRKVEEGKRKIAYNTNPLNDSLET